MIREIGRGGMGIVYEAEQLSLGRRVALKVLPFAGMLDERMLTRFRNEARAAATLNHSNIVPIIGSGDERGIYYYAMQLIRGCTLADHIAGIRGQESGFRSQGAGTGANRGNREEKKTEDSKGSQEDEESHTDLPWLSSIHLSTPSSPGVESEATLYPPVPPVQSASPLLPLLTSVPSPVRGSAETGRITGSTLPLSNALAAKEHFRRVAEIGIQVAEALHYAHERGIIHRDIKPGNLLLDKAGKVWITDFGLARIEGESNLTLTGDLLGTLRYMSPEQALGSRMGVDRRTDIYSLGATLFELLTLKPIVSGDSRGEILQQLWMNGRPCFPEFNKTVPTRLQDVLLKAIRKRPHERYSTALELAEDIQRFLDGKPVKARRARHNFPSRRSMMTAMCLAAVAGLVFCGWFANTNQSKRSRHSTQIQRQDSTSPELNGNDGTRDRNNPQVPIPAPPGLVAWWSGDGHAQDCVAGNHGSLEGGAGFGRGMAGQAFSLDGIDDYIRVPHHSSFDTLAELTIECWIHPIVTNGPRVIVAKWSDFTHDWSFIFKKANVYDGLRLELSESAQKKSVDLRGKSPAPRAKWAHVAATYDGNIARLYLDGVKENKQTVGPGRYVHSGRMDLIIGANDCGPSAIQECFCGLIDELSLYSRALGPEEIWNIYRAGSAGKIKPANEL